MTLSWLPLTMLLVFAIASRTICNPSASAPSDASPAELHALATHLFRQPLVAIEAELGRPYDDRGVRKRRWQCYRKEALDLHIFYDSQERASSVLICQQRPNKTLLMAWPPAGQNKRLLLARQ